MFAILAVLSDIPMYIAELISGLTGADMSGFVDFFNNGFSNAIDAFEQILSKIG